MPTPIPGYTFDTEKNRYFKIIPNNLALEGSKYSAKEVERRNKKRADHEEKVRRQRALTKATRLPPIQRLGNGLKLVRELGLTRLLMKQSVLENWANGLERRALFYADYPRLHTPDITHFVRDELTETFLFTQGTLEYEMQFLSGAKPLPFQPEEFEEGSIDHRINCRFVSYLCEQPVDEAPISSLSLSRSRVLLATHIAKSNPAITFMPLLDLPEYESKTNHLLRDQPPGEVVILPNLVKIRGSSNEGIVFPAWCSAANPFSEQTKFAVGFNSKVSEISGTEDTFSCLSNQTGLFDSISGIDWLDHNTIISGGRVGEVKLWDTRSRGEGVRFRHPSPINHVRKLEGTQVAVAGTNESIHIQDLRIPPGSPKPGKIDEPYMAFPTSGGPVASRMVAGFDVHGDLIASATADGRVQLFSIASGKELQMKNIKNESPNASFKRCLKFFDDERSSLKLFVASVGAVQEWS